MSAGLPRTASVPSVPSAAGRSISARGLPRNTRSAAPTKNRQPTTRPASTARTERAHRASPSISMAEAAPGDSVSRSLRREPLQYGNRRGQQRRHLSRQRLPRERLTFAPVRLAVPRRHLAEIEAHVGVRIVVLKHVPAMARLHVNAEFFVQFARERRFHRFARLQLAARKFPIAFVWFSGGPLREQIAD